MQKPLHSASQKILCTICISWNNPGLGAENGGYNQCHWDMRCLRGSFITGIEDLRFSHRNSDFKQNWRFFLKQHVLSSILPLFLTSTSPSPTPSPRSTVLHFLVAWWIVDYLAWGTILKILFKRLDWLRPVPGLGLLNDSCKWEQQEQHKSILRSRPNTCTP